MRQGRTNAFDALSACIVIALVAADAALWYQIVFSVPGTSAAPRISFLDVGQGDAELLVLPGNIKVMTDAGPGSMVLANLEGVLGAGDHYIDIAIVSHPQGDHFGGYDYILDRYRIGVFIYNGRNDDPEVEAWPALRKKIAAKHIPLITLGKSDRIVYGADEIDIVSPDPAFAESGELNDTGIVELIKTPQFKVLLAADIGSGAENALVARGADLKADILKIPHHGSKYSSGDAFLRAIDPRIAVIEVGAKNTYGHPAPETLARIASSAHAAVFRTDMNGMITIWREGNALTVKKGK